jgi:hypothetical protein
MLCLCSALFSKNKPNPMNFKPIFSFCISLSLSFAAFGQTQIDSTAASPQSRLLRFAESDTTNSDRALLKVFIRDQEASVPLFGATVLLTRYNPDQVHGKVTQWDGKCRFKVAPGIYTFRVQLTGLVTFEKTNLELAAGREYEIEVEMARAGNPAPSAKQQAAKNR